MISKGLQKEIVRDQLEDGEKISPRFPAHVRQFLCTHVGIDGWYFGPVHPAIDWLLEQKLAKVGYRKNPIGFGRKGGVKVGGRAHEALLTFINAREFGQK